MNKHVFLIILALVSDNPAITSSIRETTKPAESKECSVYK